MNIFRSIIESAVGSAIAEHPKYFTPRGQEKAQAAIVRKIMAALREDDGESAEAITQTEPAFVYADPQSAEARGYINLRRMAGANEARRTSDQKIMMRKEAHCPAVAALAELPDRNFWLFLTEVHQIRAWMDFCREMLGDVGRRSIMESRGAHTGIVMPYPFPPSKTGKIYDADTELEYGAASESEREEDAA